MILDLFLELYNIIYTHLKTIIYICICKKIKKENYYEKNNIYFFSNQKDKPY